MQRESLKLVGSKIADPSDAFLVVPEKNFGAGGSARTIIEIDEGFSNEGFNLTIIYKYARQVAERVGARRIVDLGGRSPTFLAEVFGDDHFDRILVKCSAPTPIDADADKPSTCRRLYADLNDPGDLDRVALAIDGREPTLFILADIIHCQSDARPLLRMLRRLLRQNANTRLVLASPDRDGSKLEGSNNLPQDARFVRLWTRQELTFTLRSSGFDVVQIDTISTDPDRDCAQTIVAEVGCSTQSYSAFLTLNDLPTPADHLVITTEHCDALSTGGIGTYHYYAEKACGRRLILYVGAKGLPNDWRAFVRSKGWLHTAMFLSESAVTGRAVASVDPADVLKAVEHILFLYDEIKLVEYQDYLGIGARVAQAKRVGLLPAGVCVAAFAHGTHFYLDHAAGAFDTNRAIEVDVQERIGLEQADVVISPTEFLKDLYERQQGLSFRRLVLQKIPAAFNRSKVKDVVFEPVDTLIFFGKQTPQKGYPEFCRALQTLLTDPTYSAAASHLRRVICIGVEEVAPELLPFEQIEFSTGVVERHKALDIIARNAGRCITVLPYKGDNHPLSILEVVEAGCQIQAFAVGGVPEMVPEELHSELLCSPTSRALADAMAKNIVRPIRERKDLVEKTIALMDERFAEVGRNYRKTLRELKNAALAPRLARNAFSVIVPNLNGEYRYFDELALGLRNSTFAPEHVHFVDDGSSRAGLTALEAGAMRLGSLAYTIHKNAENLGLAAARNVGLSKVSTPYVCAHDNDNIALNRYLGVACRVLDENPDVAAVTAWSAGFNDGTSFRAQREAWDYNYRPLGQDLGAGLRANVFGDALAVYRTEALRNIGGWDGTSKGTWEDWQLFARMTAAGFKIWVIPQEMFLYRMREGSMLQTYAHFPGELRLASVFNSIPRADAVSVMKVMRAGIKDNRTGQDIFNANQNPFDDFVELTGIGRAQYRKTATTIVRFLKKDNLLSKACLISLKGVGIVLRRIVKEKD